MGSISKAQGAVCVKCGRRNFLNPAQIEQGFTCPRCGTFNHPNAGPEGEKPAEAKKEEEPKDIQVQCPVCRLDSVVPKERKFKLLCLCPHCDSIFVKPKKVAEPQPEAKKGETKDAPKEERPEEKASDKEPEAKRGETEKGKPAKEQQAPTPETEPEKKPEPPPENPPTPEQLRLLSELLIAGKPESPDHANEILSAVNGIANDAICENFMGFRHLHKSSKDPLIKGLAASPLFRKVYFENESLSFEEAKAMLEEAFESDPELRAALRVNVEEGAFNSVVDYITEYSSARHRLSLEQTEARILALKAFRRGFGAKLRPAAPSVYGRDGIVGHTARKPSREELRALSRKRSPENAALDTLLEDSEFIQKPDPYNGCLLFAAFALASPALMAYLLI